MSQLTQQLHTSEISDILENSLNGIRPTKDDYLRLLESNDIQLMGLVGGKLSEKRFGKKASFVNSLKKYLSCLSVLSIIGATQNL